MSNRGNGNSTNTNRLTAIISQRRWKMGWMVITCPANAANAKVTNHPQRAGTRKASNPGTIRARGLLGSRQY